MNKLLRSVLLFISICLFSSFAMAGNNDTEVRQWVRQVLFNTLSVNYTQKAADFSQVRENYTFNAWGGLVLFLGGYLNVIREKKLIVHPVFHGIPNIVDSGEYNGVNYWRVNQQVSLPELNITVYFSLFIMARPISGSPFIIQSMDMIKNSI